MPPSPNSPETTTATPPSPPARAPRATRAIPPAASSTPPAAPRISGTPASAATTSPGSIACDNDSAAYARRSSRIHTPSGPQASPRMIASANARCMIPLDSISRPRRGRGACRVSSRRAASVLVRVVGDGDGLAGAVEDHELVAVGAAQDVGGQRLLGRAERDLAVVEAEHPRPRARLGDVVGGDEQRAALGAQLGEDALDLRRARAVHAGQR